MAYALDTLRVLVVDKNAHIRQLLRTILQTVGTGQIDLAGDAAAGFEKYCTIDYDIVFTDSDLEPVTGLDFVDLIRRSPKSPNPYVPIIMLSAFTEDEQVGRARDHGVTEFLAKPFTVDIVLKRLESAVENPRPFVRTNSYFGPDRRRKPSLDHDRPERRETTLAAVKLPKSDIASRQRAEAQNGERAVDLLLHDETAVAAGMDYRGSVLRGSRGNGGA